MSSFREVDSTIDYRSNDESRYRQQRTGRRYLRNLERQMSDKHLKRRAQIIQLENNNNNNHRFRLLHQHGNSTSTSSLSLNDMHHQCENQYQTYHHTDQGGHFVSHNKKRSFLGKMMLLVVIIVILISAISIWHFLFPSSGLVKKRKVPSIIFGGRKNNEYEKGDRDESNRSYQDLADSIKRLRNRRQVLKDEKAGEWGERKEEGQVANADDEDDDRLKRLEQKIQMEQNRKVREELLLSNKNDQDGKTNLGIEGNVAGNTNHQYRNEKQHVHYHPVNTAALKDKVMSDNIAALKLLNDKKKRENDQNDHTGNGGGN